MHDDNQALPTVLTDEDINQLTWGVMEVLAAAGIALSPFDANVASTYTSLRDAIGVLNQKGYGITSAAGGAADVITGTFSPAVTALANGMTLHVRAAAANTTTTPTFAANGTAAKVVVKGSGAALAAGDIAGAGHWITLQFDAALDKWVLLNPATGINVLAQSSQGSYSKLVISALGTNAVVNISVDEIVLGNGAGAYLTVRGASGSINTTAAAGLGGIDTGVTAANTWYAIWMVSNGSTTGYIYSLSATAPTMPGGYTLKHRVGWFKTDNTVNKFPLPIEQEDDRVSYAPNTGRNLTALPIMSSGVQGSPTVPTWVAVAVGAFIPPTASAIDVAVQISTNTAMAAPNNSYGAITSTTNKPPVCASSSAASNFSVSRLMRLESASVYFASDNTGGALVCAGWKDSL